MNNEDEIQAPAPIEEIEARKEIALDPKQQEAVSLCCDTTRRVVAITGPAGSGKTTIMRTVHIALTKHGYHCALAAPTGKAAKRIFEATGIRASTIHKLLEYTHPGEPDPKTGKPSGVSEPRRWNGAPLDQDVIIVDEYAMVNQSVHRALIDAMKPGSRVLVFGDVNQLPPIAEYRSERSEFSPFQQLLKKFPKVELETIHRQGEGSGIVSNGQRILKGLSPMQRDDFSISLTDDALKVLGIIVRRAKTDNIDYTAVTNQIITPARKTWCGSTAINGMLQQIFERAEDPKLLLERSKWSKGEEAKKIAIRVGSKIIQTQNDYNLNIFNGESGIVRSINTEFGTFEVDFGDRTVEIPPVLEYRDFDRNAETMINKIYNPQCSIELAYALTTHKSQGSEYEHVIYVMNKSMWMLQIRSNFYTAVTRARKHVTILSDSRSFQSAIRRTEVTF